MLSSPYRELDLIALIHTVAARHAIDPALVCAVAEQESSWDPYAIRYEAGFRLRYVAPLGLLPTEEVARSISWGLLQVMGQVAREHGFDAKFLSVLTEPATGLETGCAILAAKLSQASGDVFEALSLWNGGANPNYATEVLERMGRFRLE